MTKSDTDRESPKQAAQQMIQNIGLSAAQQKSLDTFKSLLQRGQRRNTTYIPPAQLRRLNASQRAIVRKAVASDVTRDDIDRLVNQQRQTMENFRMQSIARMTAQRLFNLSRQSAWESLNAKGLINGYRRYWRHMGDERVRTTHRAIPGMNRDGVGLQQPFKTPLGEAHSPPLEAGCRCRIELRSPRP